MYLRFSHATKQFEDNLKCFMNYIPFSENAPLFGYFSVAVIPLFPCGNKEFKIYEYFLSYIQYQPYLTCGNI